MSFAILSLIVMLQSGAPKFETVSAFASQMGIQVKGDPNMGRMSLMLTPNLATPGEIAKLLTCHIENGAIIRTKSDSKLLAAENIAYRQGAFSLDFQSTFLKNQEGPWDVETLETDKRRDEAFWKTANRSKLNKDILNNHRVPMQDSPFARISTAIAKNLGSHFLGSLGFDTQIGYSTDPIGSEREIQGSGIGMTATAIADPEKAWLQSQDHISSIPGQAPPKTYYIETGPNKGKKLFDSTPSDPNSIDSIHLGISSTLYGSSVTCSAYSKTGEMIDSASAVLPAKNPEEQAPLAISGTSSLLPEHFARIAGSSHSTPYFFVPGNHHLFESTRNAESRKKEIEGVFHDFGTIDPEQSILGGAINLIAKKLGDTQLCCLISDHTLAEFDVQEWLHGDRVNLSDLWRVLSKNYKITSSNQTLTIVPRDELQEETYGISRKFLAEFPAITNIKSGESAFLAFVPIFNKLTMYAMESHLVQQEVRYCASPSFSQLGGDLFRPGMVHGGWEMNPDKFRLLAAMSSVANLGTRLDSKQITYPTDNALDRQALENYLSQYASYYGHDRDIRYNSLTSLPATNPYLDGYYRQTVTNLYFARLPFEGDVEVPGANSGPRSFANFRFMAYHGPNDTPSQLPYYKIQAFSVLGQLRLANGTIISVSFRLPNGKPIPIQYTEIPEAIRDRMAQSK